MMRISGIGFTFLGVGMMDANAVAMATQWLTFFYLPIIPVKRCRVQFLPHKGSGFSYQILSREPLNWMEIARTYFMGWTVAPLVLLGPLVIAIEEVWFGLGLPAAPHGVYAAVSIGWLVFATWKLLDRQEAKCRPPASSPPS